MDAWQVIKKQNENSIVQILVIEAEYHPMRPYSSPRDRQSRGSGSIIDIKRGLILTNAHVVADAISITGRIPKMGKRDIKLNLRSIIREKDLAIVSIDQKDLKDIIDDDDPSKFEVKLGDSMGVQQTEEILVGGYPLGETNIKYTTGIVSGFHTDEDGSLFTNSEDSYMRSPSYIQITAPLNPGVSGGPMFNRKGFQVGIASAGMMNAQSVGYAIGTRHLLANYREMLNESLPKIPTFSLRWSPMNEDMAKMKCKQNADGIYVRGVSPDSVFGSLKKGDILTEIKFADPLNYNENEHVKLREKSKNSRVITAYISKLGDVSLCGSGGPSKCNMVVPRKISMSELTDIIPYGSDISVKYCRNGKWSESKSKFEYVRSNRIRGVYPRFENYDYEIIAGLCITPLLINHIFYLAQKGFDIGGDEEFMYSPHLLICQIFPDTEAFKLKSVNSGDILVKVNGRDVNTMEDLRDAINKKEKFLTFETNNGSLFTISKEQASLESEIVEKSYDL